MVDIRSLEDLTLLYETMDIECKLAAGKDGSGALPRDFWPTYSAFANTNGGTVIFGVKEKGEEFILNGIANPGKIRAELFNCLSNRNTVSVNLLTDKHVRETTIDGRILLIVDIPRATRQQRPVYLDGNPFAEHAFRRLNDGDRPLSDDEVKRMLGEQGADSLDTSVLPGYELDDLDTATLRAYRRIFYNSNPSHPYNSEGDKEFLRLIGGWRRNRENGESGLTLAGLLMFGRLVSIREQLPFYMLDYQERLEPKAEARWIDRITLDGKWSGNLFDFYRKVYLKLTAELKIPFRLEKGERKDETPVHEALREALVNTLVHADYYGRASVLVVKRPDMFGFRNPGLMRIPVDIAIRGGESDCRNRNLLQMFRMIGLGEQAGTGIRKILLDWKTQHWSPPRLAEQVTPYEQTLLELRMISLFPTEIMRDLQHRFGPRFEQANHLEKSALALIALEKTITHGRLREATGEDPAQLSAALRRLTRDGILESTGGRGAVYHLSDDEFLVPEDVFSGTDAFCLSQVTLSSPQVTLSSPQVPLSSPQVPLSSPRVRIISSIDKGNRDEMGCLIAPQLKLPIIDNLLKIHDTIRSELLSLATEPIVKKKVSKDVMRTVIINVCSGRYVTLSCLSEIVKRTPKMLRENYLSSMVKEGILELAFPATPTHELQAYSTASTIPDN